MPPRQPSVPVCFPLANAFRLIKCLRRDELVWQAGLRGRWRGISGRGERCDQKQGDEGWVHARPFWLHSVHLNL